MAEGELLFAWHDHWRVAGGEVIESLDSPITGIVRDVRPGSAIVIQASGRALHGIVTLGGPTRGRLHIAAGSDGELRSGGLDVGLAGTILVVGSRIDAETLTRARAMGVRGIVVGGLASKERRDFSASERRQRAALHRLAPYAVLVLEGATRRPLPSPVMDVLHALAGHEVAIVGDPPMLIFDAEVDVPTPPADFVRVRGGALGGREGTWAGDRRAAAVRGRRPPRSGLGPVRRRIGDRGAARRPRALRLTAMTAPTTDSRLIVAADPDATSRLGRALGARGSRRRPGLPVGRARRGQDAPRQGVRRRAGRDGHGHLAELHPDGGVPRPAAALPYRPVSAASRPRTRSPAA